MGENAKEITFTAKVDNLTFEPAKPTEQSSLEEINQKIVDLKEARERLAAQKRKLEQAKEVFDVFQAYIEAGFTEEQAWDILITMVRNIK